MRNHLVHNRAISNWDLRLAYPDRDLNNLLYFVHPGCLETHDSTKLALTADESKAYFGSMEPGLFCFEWCNHARMGDWALLRSR